ncbi:hypothetical protein L1987_53814 [Smallanthus sonchifolius]|uniref:Uncharacterized protein n=1 Tax=Smallanthus sonchifolius TaxID=185202 RepID=A0ACB9EW93_9ASTR|nr:hypothetical protein L1987_53814 [Smallanthus sonchifolius]
MGADYWATVLIPDPSEYLAHEMIHLTSSDYINVCLVNTGHGYPFITALELRLLDITMYKDQSRSLISVHRSNFAAVMWSIKSTYGLIKLNWQGDPCVPQPWVGLNCNYNSQGAAKIISLNLSTRRLSGEIATVLANLTMIESL